MNIRISKETEIKYFGKLLQEFVIVTNKEMLVLKYEINNGKVKCL